MCFDTFFYGFHKDKKIIIEDYYGFDLITNYFRSKAKDIKKKAGWTNHQHIAVSLEDIENLHHICVSHLEYCKFNKMDRWYEDCLHFLSETEREIVPYIKTRQGVRFYAKDQTS